MILRIFILAVGNYDCHLFSFAIQTINYFNKITIM